MDGWRADSSSRDSKDRSLPIHETTQDSITSLALSVKIKKQLARIKPSMQRALPLTPVLIAALAMPAGADQYEVLYRLPGDAQDRSITITTATGSYSQYKTLLQKQKWWNNYDYATRVLRGKLVSGPDSGKDFYYTPSGANKAFATSIYSFKSTNGLVERINAQRSEVTTPGYYSIRPITEWFNNPVTWALEAAPIISSGNVDTGDANNKSSNLGKTLVAAFKGGTLTIDETNPTYSLDFTVDNSNTNQIDSAGNTATFSGAFTDEATGIPGNLLIADSGSTGGVIRLNGTSTYSGLTTVKSGTLEINGSIQSNTTIEQAGRLKGSGTINGNVANSGIVAPGNSIGTLTINGNYTQSSGGRLELEINGTQSDLLLLGQNGRVTDLAGTVLIKGNATPGFVYTGIQADQPYPSGGSLASSDASAVQAVGYHFVRGQSPDFKLLNGSPSYDANKLQFGWVQNAVSSGPDTTKSGQGGTIVVPNTDPGQTTIDSVKQTGGGITSTITQTKTQSQAQCVANTANPTACNTTTSSGGTSGSSGSNTNNVEKAKVVDAGMTSVFSAVNAGVTGGDPILSSMGKPTGYTTNQAKAGLVTPDFVTVYSALLSLPTVAQVNQALHSITAEPYASMQSVALEAMEQFRANTLALTSGTKAIPFIAEEEVCTVDGNVEPRADGAQQLQPDCKPRTVQRLTPWSLLIDGTNTQATLNGTNDLASLDYNIFSSSYGLQYDFNRHWSAGAAFGYGRANLYNYEYADVRIESSTYSGAAWGIYRPSESWKFTALAGYMNLQYESDRNINFGGINRTANANWSGNGFTAALAAEYDWVLSSDKTSRSAVRIKPNTFFSYALHNQGAFSETGADSLNLALNSHTADSLIYGIGFQIETPIITGKTSRLIPRLSLGYEYDFNGDSNEEHQLTASFAEVPALGSVDVLGQNRGANALDVGLSLEYETSEALSLYAGVGGAFWSNGNELSYGGGLKLRW